MAESPCAMQLRYLQTLSSIATEQNSTIIFPIPVDVFSIFQKHFSTSSRPSAQTILTKSPTPDEHSIITTPKLASTDI